MRIGFRIILVSLLFAGIGLTDTNAQSQFFRVSVENTGQSYRYVSSGVFNTPIGESDPAPIGPGAAYEFEFDAPAGSHLSFATMFVQSNDLFYAPAENGVPLWDDSGNPRTATITSELMLWDAGTEMNQEPGAGDNQAPRQSSADTGPADSNASVRLVDDGYAYPANEDVISVMLEHMMDNRFKVTIANVSDSNTLTLSGGGSAAVPLSPGVFVVHPETSAPLFTAGQADNGDGLEAIAEDGDPAALATSLAADTGVPTVFAPGVWAVHADGMPFFDTGQPDRGEGLEALAEDGSPHELSATLAADPALTASIFAVPTGTVTAGPLPPDGAYEFVIVAEPGDRLSLATMFVHSNDLFAATEAAGLPLWDDSGNPVSGSISAMLELWDAGTEANEVLGVGPNQAPRQPSANTGPDDPDSSVRIATDTGVTLSDILEVRIEPLESVQLTLTIENVSTSSTLMTSDGSESAVPLAPGVFTVHTNRQPLFASEMQDYRRGLEALAEDGNPADLAANLADQAGVSSGVFNTPTGSSGPGPIFPGDTYEITFDAAPGARLSLATMFVPSNDAFYAPGQDGIQLWDEQGTLRLGELTAEFHLWDAGTEMNEEPGAGQYQAPTQPDPDTGPADPNNNVRLIDDGYTYPDVADVLKVTLSESTSTASENPDDALPSTVRLLQNYPNPFNPETTIRFEVNDAAEVQLTVHDVLGREVTTLMSRAVEPGSHSVTWTGADENGQAVASGIYLVRLKAGSTIETRTMTLLK